MLTRLRDDDGCQFEILIDICGVDYPERAERFDVVYHLLSARLNQRIRVKLETDEDDAGGERIPVYPAANWFEREAYDMYGILFSGPPGPAPPAHRLRLPGPSAAQGLSAHRLRRGALRRRAKRVVYEPVKLTQEFRTFDFESPWEGDDTCCRATRRRGAKQ